MQKASAKLEFEKAAHLRDQIKELKQRAGIDAPSPKRKAKVKYNLARKIEKDS
jgi:excinuclease UvrABC nuclease subunit